MRQFKNARSENAIIDITPGMRGDFIEADKPQKIAKAANELTPTLQKSECFRVKASEGEDVVLYFEPSATQDLKPSGFPVGQTTRQNRPNPSNSPKETSNNFIVSYNIIYKLRLLTFLCLVVYAAKGLTVR